MQKQAVTNQASVNEQVNRIPIQLLHLRTADEPAEPESPRQNLGGCGIVGRVRDLVGLISQVDQIFERALQALKNATELV